MGDMSTQRIEAYLARKERALGLDPEVIHSFDNPADGGTQLLVSDVRTILEERRELLAALKPFRDLFAGIYGPASVSVSFKVADIAPFYVAARAAIRKAEGR